jgi:hypothetical protein
VGVSLELQGSVASSCRAPELLPPCLPHCQVKFRKLAGGLGLLLSLVGAECVCVGDGGVEQPPAGFSVASACGQNHSGVWFHMFIHSGFHTAHGHDVSVTLETCTGMLCLGGCAEADSVNFDTAV